LVARHSVGLEVSVEAPQVLTFAENKSCVRQYTGVSAKFSLDDNDDDEDDDVDDDVEDAYDGDDDDNL